MAKAKTPIEKAIALILRNNTVATATATAVTRATASAIRREMKANGIILSAPEATALGNWHFGQTMLMAERNTKNGLTYRDGEWHAIS